jgi:hypothetical protein
MSAHFSSTGSSTPAPEEKAEQAFPSWVITAVCAVLLVVHLILRFSYGTMKDGLDAIALGLAVVGLSPWIARVVKTMKFGGVEVSFQEVKEEVRRQGEKVERQGSEIEQLRFLIEHLLPQWEVQHLKYLADSGPFEVDLDHTSREFEGELRHLRGLGLIEHTGDATLSSFMHSGGRTKNVKDYFRLTSKGREYLKYREQSGAVTRPSRQGTGGGDPSER